MNTLVRDALLAHLPPGTRGRPYNGATKYLFNCPACVARGHSRDRTKRASVFVNPDGSTGYDCFQCYLRTRQQPNAYLATNMEQVLGYMGMSATALQKLRFDVWHAVKTLQRQAAIPVPTITAQPLPSGAKTIGQWIALNPSNADFNDLLLHLADMSDQLRDSYYWTADPGPSGDMSRRYIWAIGPQGKPPIGWAAKSIDDEDAEDILSDPNIWFCED